MSEIIDIPLKISEIENFKLKSLVAFETLDDKLFYLKSMHCIICVNF